MDRELNRFNGRVLHVNSYFGTNAIHCQLVERLNANFIKQTVFVPLSTSDDFDIQSVSDTETVNFRISKVFDSWHKYVWPLKVWKCWRALQRVVKEHEQDWTISHGHTLISNGILSYALWRSRGIPYVITVRNTDVNVFMARSAFFRGIAKVILRNASFIVLPNEVYGKVHLQKHLGAIFMQQLAERMMVLPNGVDDFWLANMAREARKISSKVVRIGFIGRVDENKNIRRVISTAELLSQRGVNVMVHIVGDGPLLDEIRAADALVPVVCVGRVCEKMDLLNCMKEMDVLVVPSFTETFGVVYVEAMSQGIPIIYTKEEGFDGFFSDGEVGYSVNPVDVVDIANRVQDILKDYESMSDRTRSRARKFDWNLIVDDWISVYGKVATRKRV